MVSVATCLDKNDGVKMAQRWCRECKDSKYKKTLFRIKDLLLRNNKFTIRILLISPFVCDLAMWCQMVPFGTLKRMDLQKNF